MTPVRRVFRLLAIALFPLVLGATCYAFRIGFYYWEQVVFVLATGINVLILAQETRSFRSREVAVVGVTAVTTFLAICFVGVWFLSR